jgi:ribosomal-protein-alanine N-acetyltransferase
MANVRTLASSSTLESPFSVCSPNQTDLPGIWTIEQTLLGPWTESQLRDELTLGHGWQLVAKDRAGTVCGYLFGSIVVDEAEIRKIAVAESCRRQGVADLLLATMCQDLARRQVSNCFLELRASNLAALSLYQKNGFEVIGLRRSYYTLPTEDAMILQKSFNHGQEILR